MNKTFCKQCGKATEYSLSKPKFCAHCSATFGLASASAPAPAVNPFLARPSPPPKAIPMPPAAAQSLEFVDLDEQDDLDVDGAVQGSGEMEVELVGVKRPKVKIGEIAQNKKLNLKEIEAMRPKNAKVSKKQFLEDFSREAGAIRPQSRNRRLKTTSSE